ncbi:methyltransferase domain-containing protein [Aspergillus unguis]
MADTSSENHPSHLSPSELGTKEYWETFYSRTLTHISSKHNHTQDGQRDEDKYTHSDDENNKDNDDSEDDEEEEDSEYNGDSDPGTSWFSEHNAPQKVLDFLTRDSFPLAPANTIPGFSKRNYKSKSKGAVLSAEEKNTQPSILDLGTGNGSMLALLRKRGGYKGRMVGVDYSAKSVELARELQESRRHEAYLSADDSDEDSEGGFSEDEAEGQGQDRVEGKEGGEEEWDPIDFEEWDILNSEDDLREKKIPWFPFEQGGFDIVLDKGTFDAVSLMVEKSQCERYPGIAGGLVRKGGFLVVTSCNWTEEEVVKWFTGAGLVGAGDEADAGKLVVWGRVQYPRFKFGGQEGQGVCTVCFQRV